MMEVIDGQFIPCEVFSGRPLTTRNYHDIFEHRSLPAFTIQQAKLWGLKIRTPELPHIENYINVEGYEFGVDFIDFVCKANNLIDSNVRAVLKVLDELRAEGEEDRMARAPVMIDVSSFYYRLDRALKERFPTMDMAAWSKGEVVRGAWVAYLLSAGQERESDRRLHFMQAVFGKEVFTVPVGCVHTSGGMWERVAEDDPRSEARGFVVNTADGLRLFASDLRRKRDCVGHVNVSRQKITTDRIDHWMLYDGSDWVQTFVRCVVSWIRCTASKSGMIPHVPVPITDMDHEICRGLKILAAYNLYADDVRHLKYLVNTNYPELLTLCPSGVPDDAVVAVVYEYLCSMSEGCSPDTYEMLMRLEAELPSVEFDLVTSPVMEEVTCDVEVDDGFRLDGELVSFWSYDRLNVPIWVDGMWFVMTLYKAPGVINQNAMQVQSDFRRVYSIENGFSTVAPSTNYVSYCEERIGDVVVNTIDEFIVWWSQFESIVGGTGGLIVLDGKVKGIVNGVIRDPDLWLSSNVIDVLVGCDVLSEFKDPIEVRMLGIVELAYVIGREGITDYDDFLDHANVRGWDASHDDFTFVKNSLQGLY
jgi:hypothetical protein